MVDFNRNQFAGRGPEAPGMPRCAFAIVPNDVDTYTPGIHVYVGVGGSVSVIPDNPINATPVVFTGLQTGSVLPVICRTVLATGTTATTLIGLV